MSQGRLIQTNAAMLVGLQILNYLLPFLLIPILIRRLGLDHFGIWALAMSIVSVLRTVVAYGFDLSAARDIAQRPKDAELAGDLLGSIGALRLLFLVLPGALLALAAPWSGLAGIDTPLIALSVATLIGDALAPVWLFHGHGDLPLANALRIASRLVMLVLVLAFVKGPSDLLLVPAIEAVTSLLYCIVAVGVAARRYRIDEVRVRFESVCRGLAAGLHIFIANASVHSYTTLNGILLGALLGPVVYAHYAVAEKIYFGVRGLIQTAVQAVFPLLAHLSAHDGTGYRRMARRLLAWYFGFCGAAALALTIGAPLAIRIVAGAADPTAVSSMRAFAIALLFSGGGVFATLHIAQDQPKHLSAITAVTVAANLLAIWPLVSAFGAVGAVAAFLLAQAVQTVIYLRVNARLLSPTAH